MARAETAEIHRCGRFLVRRQTSAGRTVVQKIARATPRCPGAAALLRSEAAVLRRLDVPGVARLIALLGPEDAPVLVLEDAGAEDLERRIAGGPLALGELLDVAIALAEACARLHERGVVHRALAPRRVLLGPGGEVTLVHFTDAAELTSVPGAAALEDLKALPFKAPEQLGRMNRFVDCRSDLYALGAILYAMLTGAPPFQEPDPLALVHSHAARCPVPAHVVNPAVPAALSELTQRLLAKMPELRYESAASLAEDLREARRQWRAEGAIAPFELGRLDLARRLPLPERVVGRDRELAALQAAVERVSGGATELFLVTGDAGVGKTTLVEAARAAVTERGGWFVSGKLDQRAADVPYAPVVEALRALALALRAEAEAPAGRDCAQRVRAAGEQGRALAEICPEIGALFAAAPPLPAADPLRAEGRLLLALQVFVRAVAGAAPEDGPLAIFLDDLQWTDAASLRALCALATDPGSRRVLLLGAYRPKELGITHPLHATLQAIRQAQVAPITRVSLGPLDLEALVALLAGWLRCGPERARPLAGLVLARTAGNPFFVRQLLRALQRQGLLAFDAAGSTWAWDLRRIERVEITDNVVELMTEAVRQLPEEAQELLQIAACAGNRAEIGLLAAVSGRSVDEATAALGQPLREGLLVADSEPGAGLAVRFAHDRVQQTAYELVPEGRRRALHLRIGRHLEAACRDGADDALFDAVNQLDLGAALLGAEEREELAALNHRAGLKARGAAAYGPALSCFRRGLGLLPEGARASRRALWLALRRDAAECAALTGEHATARALVEEALRCAASIPERVDLEAIRLLSATLTGEHALALRWGRAALRDGFGVELPSPDHEADLEAETAAQRRAVEARLGGRPPESLVDLPLMTGSEERAHMKLVSGMITPAWFAERRQLSLLTLIGVRFALEHGNSSEAILPYAAHALFLAAEGDLAGAQGFGRLAVELARRLGDRAQETVALQIYTEFVGPWVAPFASCAALFRDVVALGLSSGELRYAAYAYTGIVEHTLAAGVALDRALLDLDEGLAFSRQTGNKATLLHLRAYRQMIRCLKGLTRGRNRFDDDDFDERAFLDAAQGEPAVACVYHILRLETSYLLRDQAEAIAQSEATIPCLQFLDGYIAGCQRAFFAVLTLLWRCDGASAEERAALLAEVHDVRRTFGRWESTCADNFHGVRLLIDAEIARVSRDVEAAGALYDEAIAAATSAGIAPAAALGNELAGRFYHGLGRARIAAMYLRAARRGYASWGASEKARALAEELRIDEGEEPGADEERYPAAALDALSLLKAAETLSGEIVLDRLLEKLLGVCLEAAGAERGALVLEEDGGLFVRAAGRAAGPVSIERAPLAGSREVPEKIVERARRTREIVVVDDAASDPDLAGDPRFAGGGAGSVLLLPLQRKGALLGVLYLENSLATRAFTRDRVHVLELLSAQIAIALENACLYRAAQDAIHVRDEFLSVASHELKTPVTSLRLGLQGLIHQRGRVPEERAARALLRVDRQVQRLIRLIDDLLDVSQIHTGRLALHVEPVDLAEAVGDVVERLGERIAQSGSRVDVRAEPAVVGSWDRSRLDQVISNLLDNALKFGAGKPIEVSVARREGTAVLAVRDHGIGIPADRLAHVFERFERAVSNRHYGGLGLGLYVVKSIVEALGGAVRADSLPDEGTRLTVELPCAPPPSSRAAPPLSLGDARP
ncbi:protein kinase [Sorangium cellulosum]|uniref:histidine kinase n=1 Tax=Sorangium cellulosum TaxID=56 RepID=A0A2L0ELR9_SORCE|nr:AAA family ATPase [Sorangium cellulosum]AUX40235.1 protein kinase [Sorangium cellulosum]